MEGECALITTVPLHSPFHLVKLNIVLSSIDYVNSFAVVDMTDMVEIRSFILFHICGRKNNGLMLFVFRA